MKRAALGGLLLVGAAGAALWLALRNPVRPAPPPPPPAVEPARETAVVEREPVVPPAPTREREPVRERPDKATASPDAQLAAGNVAPPPTRAWPEGDEPRVWLHVRDRQSGRELAPVSVVALDGALGRATRPTERAAESAEDFGPSPVPVRAPETGQVRTLFARSPTHAWGRIELGAGQEERFLDLDPAGDLRISVAGGPRDPGTQVRVFGSDRSPLFEIELGDRAELLVEALPVGQVEIVAQLGTYLRPRDLGRVAAEIVAGTTASVELELEPPEPAQWVPLAGSLVLPPEWELVDFRLGFQLQGAALEDWRGEGSVSRSEMEVADEAAGLHRWDAGDVQPGMYGLELLEVGFSTTVEVGPAGVRDVHIAIPPPCTVRLVCIDAATRASRGPIQLFWSSMAGRVHALVEVGGWNEERGCFELRVPCGGLRIYCPDGPGHESRTMDFQVDPGTDELEFVLTAPTGLQPVLMDGATRVPWDLRRMPTLEPLDGQESPSAILRQQRLTMKVVEPGRYLLRVPALDGYEQVPDRVVELEEGELLELPVELVRRP